MSKPLSRPVQNRTDAFANNFSVFLVWILFFTHNTCLNALFLNLSSKLGICKLCKTNKYIIIKLMQSMLNIP